MTNQAIHAGRRQQGATLVVALVMLVLMTMLAISAINISTGNLKVVGNMQLQQEATSAAQAGIAQVLSSGRYMLEPSTAPDETTINVNGTDYKVALKKPCLKSAVIITVQELSALPPYEAIKCKSSSAIVNSGVMGHSTGGAPSDCARATWEIQATVDDPATNARAVMTEGATIKMDRVLAEAYKSNPAMVCS